MMRAYILLAALLLISSANALPETITQEITATASATDTADMVGTNTASAGGDSATVSQNVKQITNAASTTEHASNTANISVDNGSMNRDSDASIYQFISQIADADLGSMQFADNIGQADLEDVAFGQSISQAASGEDTSQTGGNLANTSDDGAKISQYLAQAGSAGDNALQSGNNTAYALGDDANVGQEASSSATADSVAQTIANLAELGGSDPVVVQHNAAVALGDNLPKQGQYNSAYYLLSSEGGLISQQALGSAIVDSALQIRKNLIARK